MVLDSYPATPLDRGHERVRSFISELVGDKLAAKEAFLDRPRLTMLPPTAWETGEAREEFLEKTSRPLASV
ncbi:MAG: hypothetical protein JW395_3487 [Nitrospira sp.]|nr:hypothetical protein [Nitrospira sp.]